MICNFTPSFDGTHSSPGISEMILVAKYLGLIGILSFCFFPVSQGFYHKNWRDLDIECCFCLVCVID